MAKLRLEVGEFFLEDCERGEDYVIGLEGAARLDIHVELIGFTGGVVGGLVHVLVQLGELALGPTKRMCAIEAMEAMKFMN